MATVKERFEADPYDFDFFAAMRVLERLHPDRKPIGVDFLPGDEIVRMRSHLSLSFPPSQIFELLPPTDERAMPLMTCTFFGLYGVTGVLPTHYTQMMMDIVRDVRGPERRSLRDWLDLFNHRFLSLFYKSWEKYRFYVPFERGTSRGDNPDPFTIAMKSLVGIGTAGHANRMEVRSLAKDREAEVMHWGEKADAPPLSRIDDLSLLYYAGLFVQRPRNPSNLRAILADYFGLEVEVLAFQGQWLPIPEATQTRLGEFGSLGVNAMAGDKVWNLESKFRIRLGPLMYNQFIDLLPDLDPVPERKSFFLVAQLVRMFVGPEYDFDIQLVLRAPSIPEADLNDALNPGPRLGWNMWLISETPATNAEEAIFDGEWVRNLA